MLRPSLLLVLLLGAALPDSQWQRVLPGLELRYPRDHGAHPSHRIEWWYLTGQLESASGRRFGFQFTIFRSGLGAGPAGPEVSTARAREVFAGHLALTDVEAQRTRFAERLRRGGTPLAEAASEDLELALEDWSLVRAPGDRLSLSAADPAAGFGLELQLEAHRPLVRHGERGYSAKGGEPGNASAYVSWTRLETRGCVRLDGVELEVTGEAWFDHEYGSSVLGEGVVGWDWFGLQLADGRELMLFQLRREDGSRAPASAGTLVEADGRPRALSGADFELEPLASWSSPRTAAVYPARWRVAVPSAALRFELQPLVPDCELGARAGATTYWEGPVQLSGAATGFGYAELTGYAGTMQGRF